MDYSFLEPLGMRDERWSLAIVFTSARRWLDSAYCGRAGPG
jgi:hypothetical protein